MELARRQSCSSTVPASYQFCILLGGLKGLEPLCTFEVREWVQEGEGARWETSSEVGAVVQARLMLSGGALASVLPGRERMEWRCAQGENHWCCLGRDGGGK